MEEYVELVQKILENGNYKPNRTASDTISTFGHFYRVDLSEGFPLLTTKDMSGYRWKSLIHELLWYFSGEHHIRNLKDQTKIWNAWADDEWNLPTAYGRFWRRFPVPEKDSRLEGEWWPVKGSEGMKKAAEHYDVSGEEIDSAIDRWVSEEEDGRKVFDQIQYVIDTLKDEHPYRGPESRRIVVSAWHPANAAVSKLPPCHYTFVFNVQNGKLNTHMTQRSCDTALGVPFNIAAYFLITMMIAQEAGLDLGYFGHSLVDAHIYCGKHERGEWYGDNLEELKSRMRSASAREDYLEVRNWVLDNAPDEREGEERYDHVPGLLKQISREPRQRPDMEIADKQLDELEFEDFELENYDPHPGIKFSVAE